VRTLAVTLESELIELLPVEAPWSDSAVWPVCTFAVTLESELPELLPIDESVDDHRHTFPRSAVYGFLVTTKID